MKKAIHILVVIAVISITGCGPARFVKTLKKNENAVSFSFGGPLIKFAGAVIPIPFTTLCYGRGVSDKVTVFGSFHPTSLFFGNLQSDLGATFRLFEKENKFGLSASPALQLASSLSASKTFRIWPSADVNFYLHPKSRQSYFYAGINMWFEPSAKKAHDEAQSRHVIPNLQAGYTVIKTKWQHQFEVRYLGIGIPNTPGVVGYVGPSGKGSFGVYYSLIKKF
jgi:hypothetical protein